ncbi:FadR/GntR family transcriptional regulator [Mycolicibacterium sp. XJ1819]
MTLRDLNSRGRPHEIKLARRTAQRIEDDILAAGHSPGTLFASESELRERYGVSRAVLREAIRLVEHHGLAVMRRGPYGGLILRAPDSRAMTQAVLVYLEYVGTSVQDLLAVRLLLEPLAARLAAQNMTEEHLATIRSALAQERAGELASGGRELFHILLGNMGGNRVLGLFVEVLARLTGRYATIPGPPGATETTGLRAESDTAQARIAEAVIAGDATLAEHRCVIHLEAMRDWLLSVRQRPIRRRPRRADPGVLEPTGREKLAEAVARRLMADIAASGVPVGEIYGSETELVNRLDVSRAAFREGVRLLEYHRVARMRRGPHGGLVVTSPDPSAGVDAMAVYLEYQRVEAGELRVVRQAIELGALGLLTEHHDDPALLTELRDAQRVDSETPHEFHLRLAELTGNPVLSLFLRILLAVWDRHFSGSGGEPSDDAALAAAATEVHDRILEAIAEGDLSLARLRMHRHLAALDHWWQ